MKILDNILVILSNYSEQTKIIEKLLLRNKELEERMVHLETVISNLDGEIEIHKNSIEKLYEINIKILSVIKPKTNVQKTNFDERKSKEHIN